MVRVAAFIRVREDCVRLRFGDQRAHCARDPRHIQSGFLIDQSHLATMGRVDAGDCGGIEELQPAAASVLLPAGVSGRASVSQIARRAIGHVQDRDPARARQSGQLRPESNHFVVRMGYNQKQPSGP
jgi:hypothetical protein